MNQSQPTPPSKTRKYEVIWQRIKTAPPGQVVIVTCKAGPFQATLIQAVKKEKTKEQSPRKKMDVIGYGELIIDRFADRVEFRLRFNGDHL